MDIGYVPSLPTGIVRWGDALYVSAHPPWRRGEPDSSAPRGIFRVTPDGDPTLLTPCAFPRIMAVDADYTWTFDGLLRRASRAGGDELTLPYFSMPHWLALDGDDLFVADLSGVAVLDRRAPFTADEKVDGFRWLAKDGGTRRVIVRGDDVFYDAFVYPHPEKGCRIMRRSRRGGSARVLAEIGLETRDLGVIGDDVVIGTKAGPILRVPCSGGSVEAIDGSACGGWFATGHGRLGWFDEESAHLIVMRGRERAQRIAIDRPGSLTTLLIEERVACYGAREPDARGNHAISEALLPS